MRVFRAAGRNYGCRLQAPDRPRELDNGDAPEPAARREQVRAVRETFVAAVLERYGPNVTNLPVEVIVDIAQQDVGARKPHPTMS